MLKPQAAFAPSRNQRNAALAIFIIVAVSLTHTRTAVAHNYDDLMAQGYRWVTVNGPYACNTERDVERIVAHRTDEAELQAVEDIQCYYLIPGTIVQVVNEDPAKRMSQIRLGGITKPLWTYSRFLSKHPVQDTYGRFETPEECGLIPNAEAAAVPPPSDSLSGRTRQNENP
jgi:hypothetical protein